MKAIIRFLLPASVSCVMMGCSTNDPEHGVRSADPPAGNLIAVLGGYSAGLPTNRRWEELSAEEQERVRTLVRRYERALPPGAEVPFPAEGLMPILLVLRDIQSQYRWTGTMTEVLVVDARGDVVNVVAYGAAPLNFVLAARKGLQNIKFKPGKCGGQTCQMSFPISLNFKFATPR